MRKKAIPVDEEVRDSLKEIKGTKTYSQYIKELIQKAGVKKE
ncbi:MAG: hypothetical protein WD154_08050 [Nitrosopumilaceae archaeon]